MSEQAPSSTPQPPPSSPEAVPLEPLSSKLQIHPYYQFPWLVVSILIIGVLALWVTGFLRIGGGSMGSVANEKKAAENSVEFGNLADREAVQVSWRRLHDQLKAAQADQAGLAKDLERLTRQMAELRQSEGGRRLATDPALVEQFVTLEQQPQPTPDVLKRSRTDVEKLLKVCDRALQDQELLVEPNESLSRQADTACREASEALQKVRADLTGLAALVRRADKQQPAPGTLAETIVAFEQDREDQRLAELTKKRQAIRDAAEEQKQEIELAAEKKLREEELEQARITNARKVAEAKAKTERDEAARRDEQEKLAAEKAHAEKLRKFDKALPEIRSLLSPMISKGRMQIGRQGWAPGEEGPVSLDALKSNKVLDLNETGLYAIVILFGGPSCPNDRPRGGLPNSPPLTEPKYRRVQELLIEFGDILVEKKMLRP